jgi:hypothetical protein
MAAGMGFANLFAQAGLFTSTGSQFSGISTTSGASWMSTQLFYSANFYQKVAQEGTTPQELHDFVLSWMQAYLAMQKSVPDNPWCTKHQTTLDAVAAFAAAFFGTSDVNMMELCNLYMDNGEGDSAAFIGKMLAAVATNAYNDPGFATQTASPENRVPALQNTDLLLQTSLAPNAKCGTSVAYLSPASSASQSVQAYTVPLAAVHAVSQGGTDFRAAVTPSELPLMVSVGEAEAPSMYNVNDWSSFTVFPSPQGSSLFTSTLAAGSTSVSSTSQLPPPFGGQPTVAQVASASSDALGALSGSVPSLLTQYLSKMEALLNSLSDSLLLNLLAGTSYTELPMQNLAVDTQWTPGFRAVSCSETDLRLVDGGYTDNPSLAFNIGQYQSGVGGSDTSKTLKIFLTNMNDNGDSNVEFLSYFQTSFNSGVEPGSYLWPPSSTLATTSLEYNLTSAATPIRSAQIFETSLDESQLAQSTNSVAGTNLTYAMLSAVTTNNPAFGVSAGQPVDILYVSINNPIPTIVAGTSLTQQYAPMLADLAASIAGSHDLLTAVQSFLGTTAST